MNSVSPAEIHLISLILLLIITIATDALCGWRNLTTNRKIKGINEVSDKTVIVWVFGIVGVLMFWGLIRGIAPEPNAECDNTQYSGQSC